MPVNAEFFSYRESDIDAAQVAVEESYFVARMDLLDPAADYEFCFDGVAVGSLRLGRVWYNAAIEARFGDLQNCYLVNVPAAGAMRATHRGQTLDVAAGHGAVYHPNGSVHVRTSHDFDAYAIRIDRDTLRTALETLLEHPVNDAPDLDLDLDLTRGAGASWSMLVAALTLGSARRDTLFSQPLMAAPLQDALITGLLHVAGHRWRAELERPVPSWAPQPVARAMQLMRDQPGFPHTPTTLAAAAGISVRALHHGFRRHLDSTPMNYLRQLRLQCAHDELTTNDARDTTVNQIALRWGFPHQSRFAQIYQSRYGQPPSTTLRQPAPRSDTSATPASG
jgi:AraC-like DNA-binding protein